MWWGSTDRLFIRNIESTIFNNLKFYSILYLQLFMKKMTPLIVMWNLTRNHSGVIQMMPLHHLGLLLNLKLNIRISGCINSLRTWRKWLFLLPSFQERSCFLPHIIFFSFLKKNKNPQMKLCIDMSMAQYKLGRILIYPLHNVYIYCSYCHGYCLCGMKLSYFVLSTMR